MSPIEIRLDPQKRLIIWRTSGSITPKEVEKMRQEIDAQANIQEGWNAILDLREQDNALPIEYMRRFAESLPVFAHPVKWAVLRKTILTEGMANLFSVHVAEKKIWVRTFDRLEEAEAWLAEPFELSETK